LAHIHLPDGILPIEWIAIYWLISLSLVYAATLYFRKTGAALDINALSVAGAATASAFVVFQVEIPIFGGIHLNFTPMLGILVGAIIGSASSMIINLLSSAIGHGGWGPIGLNYLVNLAEIFVASSLFALLFRRLQVSASKSAFVSTLTALTISNVMMVGMIAISGIQGSENLALAEELQNLSILIVINEFAAVVEATVTAFLISYLVKIKPDLLGVKIR